MDVLLLVALILVVFLVLLFAGRAQVAKGANTATANGAVLLTLATVVGVLALGLVVPSTAGERQPLRNVG